MQHQTYLQDCDCKNSGIIIKDGIAVCRWCRKPYAKGGSMFYEEEHFEIKKDYEILSFYGKEGTAYVCVENTKYYLMDKTWKIHSVKRLSDNEVFTIGDKLKCNEDKNVSIIEGFELRYEGTQMWVVTDKKKDYGFDIGTEYYIKVRQPLFTTTDGKDIYEMDVYYTVADSFEVLYSNAFKGIKSTAPEIVSRSFSTEEAANEYVKMNKPCLSYMEVEVWFRNDATDKALRKLVKTKIQ